MSLNQLVDDIPKPWLNARVNSLVVDNGIINSGVLKVPGTASVNLDDSDSGKIITLAAAADNVVINLPVAREGLFFKFVTIEVPSGSHTYTIKAAGTDKMYGSYLGVAGDTGGVGNCEIFPVTAASNFILGLTAANAPIGTWATFECLAGSSGELIWFVNAASAGTGSGWSSS